jgi:hypothetical protein
MDAFSLAVPFSDIVGVAEIRRRGSKVSLMFLRFVTEFLDFCKMCK